jgi:hypothetical protein
MLYFPHVLFTRFYRLGIPERMAIIALDRAAAKAKVNSQLYSGSHTGYSTLGWVDF